MGRRQRSRVLLTTSVIACTRKYILHGKYFPGEKLTASCQENAVYLLKIRIFLLIHNIPACEDGLNGRLGRDVLEGRGKDACAYVAVCPGPLADWVDGCVAFEDCEPKWSHDDCLIRYQGEGYNSMYG